MTTSATRSAPLRRPVAVCDSARTRAKGVVLIDPMGSDLFLLRGFCDGNEECAGRFVQRFWRPLYWIAFRIVKDSGSAEDVVQIAFERAWRNGVTFEPGRGSLDGWMTTIARHAALDWLRRKRAIPIDPSETHATPTSESSDPEGWTEKEETRTDVRSALNTLSPKLARSVVLAGAFDMSAAEVACYEHIPLGTAKTRIRVAKQHLRSELSPLG
jgi:RNA polymerase sigma factor (sigma-70 family)